MPDLLKAFEKAAKAVRGGILAASDNLAFLLDDFCRYPPDPAPAEQPPAGSVVAPSPKQGSDSGSEEIAPFAVRPSEPPTTSIVAFLTDHYPIRLWEWARDPNNLKWRCNCEPVGYVSLAAWREHAALLFTDYVVPPK